MRNMEEKNNVSPDTLLTTQEIAERYGVSAYTITQCWIPKGLKHFPFKPFRFRLEWVEEFIEEQAEEEKCKRQRTNICNIIKPQKLKRLPKFNQDMKIRMEDILEG